MTAMERIKARVNELFLKGDEIHVSITLSHPRIHLDDATCVIKGVYPHIFMIEQVGVERPSNYSLQYTDLLTDCVKIKEL